MSTAEILGVIGLVLGVPAATVAIFGLIVSRREFEALAAAQRRDHEVLEKRVERNEVALRETEKNVGSATRDIAAAVAVMRKSP